jgi:hypothetical protein
MATIAVFIALGGSSYAVATISTKQLENGAVTTKKLGKGAVTTQKLRSRAVTGKKVKRNALGGDVVDESKLGKVPSAALADNAANAANATNASNSTNAGNAAALAGLGPDAFERSTRIQYGRGPSGSGTSTLLSPGRRWVSR